MDRRSGNDRRAKKCPMKLKNLHDHIIFAVLLVMVFIGIDIWLHYTWAGKGLEMVIGASIHRALFGGE